MGPRTSGSGPRRERGKLGEGDRPPAGRVHRGCPVCGRSGVQGGIRFIFSFPESPESALESVVPAAEGAPLLRATLWKGLCAHRGRAGGRGEEPWYLPSSPKAPCGGGGEGRGVGTGALASQAPGRRVSWVAGADGGCIVSLRSRPGPAPGPDVGCRRAGGSPCESRKQQGVGAQPWGGGAGEPGTGPRARVRGRARAWGPGRSPAEGTAELCVGEAGVCQGLRAGVR